MSQQFGLRNAVKAGSFQGRSGQDFRPFLPWAIALEKLTMPLQEVSVRALADIAHMDIQNVDASPR